MTRSPRTAPACPRAAGAEVSPLPNPWRRAPWNGRRGPLAAAPIVNADPAGPWDAPG